VQLRYKGARRRGQFCIAQPLAIAIALYLQQKLNGDLLYIKIISDSDAVIQFSIPFGQTIIFVLTTIIWNLA